MKIISSYSSPSYSLRPIGVIPEYIILHYTELPFEKALADYLNPNIELSCHYLICKNGEIYQLVDDEKVAWHAGASYWRGKERLNPYSFGIEIENLGNEPFTSEQIKSCITLCHNLMRKYHIPRSNILGHSDIAPERKIDPGIMFFWKELLDHSIGIEYVSVMTVDNYVIYSFGERSDGIYELQKRLSLIGYKILLTGVYDEQTNKVVRGFQAHFCPDVILEKGGIGYYISDESLFSWDKASEQVLSSIILGT